MKRKIRVVIFVLIIVIAIGIPIGKNIHDNSNVKFADETMGQILCNAQYSSELYFRIKLEFMLARMEVV